MQRMAGATRPRKHGYSPIDVANFPIQTWMNMEHMWNICIIMHQISIFYPCRLKKAINPLLNPKKSIRNPSTYIRETSSKSKSGAILALAPLAPQPILRALCATGTMPSRPARAVLEPLWQQWWQILLVEHPWPKQRINIKQHVITHVEYMHKPCDVTIK